MCTFISNIKDTDVKSYLYYLDKKRRINYINLTYNKNTNFSNAINYMHILYLSIHFYSN